MPLLRKIICSFGALSLAGGFYLRKEKVSLKNQYLRSTLLFLHSQNQKYSTWLLKSMIKFQMIGQCEEVKNYVFSYGFDFDGSFIDGLNEIGFDTIQFGPISLMPACKEQKRMHFGNKIAIGNINVFCQKRSQLQKNQPQKENSKIGIAISPNYEVLKYAPYLIADNIISCLKQCQELNEVSQNLFVNRYVIKLNDSDMIEMKSPQFILMIQQLIKNANQTTLETFQQKKNLFPEHIEKIQRPQIFIEVPNSQQNSQIFNAVKSMPIVQKLIVDGSQFEITRTVQKVNKKTVENVAQLTIGKKRISFQQLLERTIHDTL